MTLHCCSTADRPLKGQRTDHGCGCHKTDEQMMSASHAALLAALGQLETAGTAVLHKGAVTGSQWPKLSATLFYARIAIANAEQLTR